MIIKKLSIIFIYLLSTTTSFCFDTFINKDRYDASKTVIKAKSRVIESSVEIGLIDNDQETIFTSIETKKFKEKFFHDYTQAERNARGPSIDSLIKKYGEKNYDKIPKELLAKASNEDELHESDLLEQLNKEVERVGLDSKKVVFFWVGEAELTVGENYKGKIKKGKKFLVTWKIPYRVTCPASRPQGGYLGWYFDKEIEENTKVILGHGFSNYEEAKKLSNNKNGQNKSQ